MSPSSQKKVLFNPPPANGLASQSTQQPQPVCKWSAHAPQSGSSPLPFPRSGHTLTANATATAASEFFLFGGWVHSCARNDLYVLSTRDFSTTLLQTSGEVPTPRARHDAVLIGTTLLISGGKKHSGDPGDQHLLNHDSLYLLNLVSREWTRVVVNGPGPNGCLFHTTTMVGSKLFVFGGKIARKTTNDMWTLDLNRLKSQPLWELYEPTPGNKKPLPRADSVSVTTEDRIIIFGGTSNQHYYNDTWSFDISTRKWTELQCTGSIPSPRRSHAAVLVDDVMYVFGGISVERRYVDDLYALQLSTQRWFKFHNVEASPHKRSHHSMASDGTRVFVLGGYSEGARPEAMSLIHYFDTKDIKYPEPERNAANPNEKVIQLAQKSSTGPPTQVQPQPPKSSPSKARGASLLQNATHSSPEGEVKRLELERQLSVSLAAQTERDHRIAQLTDELALNNARLEQAEANAAEAARRADDRRLIQVPLAKQRDVEFVDMQARLRDMQAKLDGLLLSRDQQIGQYEKEFANVRAKLEAKESELEAVRLRLTDAERGLTKSKAEADTFRAQTATGSLNRDEDQVTRRLMERVRALEAKMVSKQRDDKSIQEMECSNED